MSDLKERLLARRIPEGTVELGEGVVTVRGLTRGEVLFLHNGKELGVIEDAASWECKMIALGMVDPPMTEDEVRQWQDSSPADELTAVNEKITELSGLAEGAEKSDLPEASRESGS